jgi:hypothetical protein
MPAQQPPLLRGELRSVLQLALQWRRLRRRLPPALL